MQYFYLLLGLGGLVLLAMVLSARRRLSRRYRYPYLAETRFFTPPQLEFKTRLEQAVGPSYRIQGRVPVTEVIALDRSAGPAACMRAAARLDGQSFEFLLCTAGTEAIACAIKLLPRSRFRRGPPRHPLAAICAAAGLPFVCVREDDPPSVATLAERLFAAMAPHHAAADPAAAEAAEPVFRIGTVELDDALEAEPPKSRAGRA